MTKDKPTSTATATTTAMTAPSSQPPTPSALSQQFDQLSLDKKRHSTSPKRPSSKRKSKSDIATATVGTDSSQPAHQQQQPQPPTHSKRSPKAAKVNGTKQQFSTPSKPKSIANGSAQNLISQPAAYNGVATELASHYAGPTFHSSPAPSSLPMPSFFTSKPKTSLQNEYDIDTSSNQNTPVKAVRSFDGDKLHDDSPLALFFKADREEKSGLRNRGYGVGTANGSPTVRPASAGDFTHEHLDLRSTSPLLWNESPREVNGRLDFKNHSTTELPFQMDLDENRRNHLGHRFRATTEPPAENRAGPLARNKLFNHTKQYSEHGANFTPQRPSSAQSRQADLESSTQTLKNLLSINSTPSSRPPSSLQQPFPGKGGEAPPSPSPIHQSHSRSQSAAQPPHWRLAPATSTSSTPRRIVSASGIPPPNHLTHPNHPQPTTSAANTSTEPISDEDQNVKAEKELRKLLNLS